MAAWLVMVAAAMANGALRELWLTPWLGDPFARALSSVTLALLIYLIIELFLAWRPGPYNDGGLWRLGAFWTLLGLAFEFGLGLGLQGRTLAEMLQDYNLLAGRLLPLVWLTTLFGPWLAARRRRQR
jgi:hypothetical protein